MHVCSDPLAFVYRIICSLCDGLSVQHRQEKQTDGQTVFCFRLISKVPEASGPSLTPEAPAASEAPEVPCVSSAEVFAAPAAFLAPEASASPVPEVSTASLTPEPLVASQAPATSSTEGRNPPIYIIEKLVRRVMTHLVEGEFDEVESVCVNGRKLCTREDPTSPWWEFSSDLTMYHRRYEPTTRSDDLNLCTSNAC
jgi:hypothetical protein